MLKKLLDDKNLVNKKDLETLIKLMYNIDAQKNCSFCGTESLSACYMQMIESFIFI